MYTYVQVYMQPHTQRFQMSIQDYVRTSTPLASVAISNPQGTPAISWSPRAATAAGWWDFAVIASARKMSRRSSRWLSRWRHPRLWVWRNISPTSRWGCWNHPGVREHWSENFHKITLGTVVVSNWTWVKYFGPKNIRQPGCKKERAWCDINNFCRAKCLKPSTCAICAFVGCHDRSFLSTVHNVGARWVFFASCQPLEVGTAGMPENRALNPRQRKVLKAGLKKVRQRRPRDQVIVDVAKSEQRCPVQLHRTPCLVANSSWVAVLLSVFFDDLKLKILACLICENDGGFVLFSYFGFCFHPFHIFSSPKGDDPQSLRRLDMALSPARHDVLGKPAALPERRGGLGTSRNLHQGFQGGEGQISDQASSPMPWSHR